MNPNHHKSADQFYRRKWQGHNGYWLDIFRPHARVYAMCLGQARNDAIFSAVPSKLGRVLDLGCGVGDLMFMLAQKCEQVTGLDIADVNVEMAQRNLANDNIKNISVAQGDAETLPFAQDSFDLVVMADVIEHIPDVAAAIVEVSRVLQGDGMFICVTPHPRFQSILSKLDALGLALTTPFQKLMGKRLGKKGPLIYEQFLTPQRIRYALEQQGFCVAHYKRICFYPGPEGRGTFSLVMRLFYQWLGADRFERFSAGIIRVFTRIERIELFNQKQMWIAQKKSV